MANFNMIWDMKLNLPLINGIDFTMLTFLLR